MRFTFKLKNLLLFFGVLIIVGGVIASVHTVTKLLTNSEKGTIEITEFEGEFKQKTNLPSLEDISYEEMRVYVFPNNTMLVIKFPKYLQYLKDGIHVVITIKDGEIKATTVSNNWDHFTIYCKEESLPFYNKKEKSKKRDF